MRGQCNSILRDRQGRGLQDMKLCTQTKRADMLSSCATLIIQRKEREGEEVGRGHRRRIEGVWRGGEEAIVPFTKATCFP